MQQITIKKTNDILYYETLDNGLQVFMIPKTNVNNTLVSFNVKYGSINNTFIPFGEKEMRTVPNGIAHFLEHKMFEQENGIDPMMFYAENGADVNAYTSLYNTSYYFSCSSHLQENLEYLLNFVQEPYFTDENVSKEKGIIEEEIKMYNDDPYSFLDEQIRLNAFENHPIKYSVAGTVEDIRAITKEDLYTCYNTFYKPSNMFLTISGNFEVNSIIEIIKQNQSKKELNLDNQITIKEFKENDEVVKTYEEKQMSVEVPKLSVGLKISLKNIKMNPKRRDYYLAILFDSLFGATSTFNEDMRNKGFLLSYVGLETIYTNSHLFVTISADTEHVTELLSAIKERLSKLEIDEEDFKNKITMFISNEIYTYEDIESINRTVINDLIIYGEYYTNNEKTLNDLNKTEFDTLIKDLDLSNATTMVIMPISNIKKEE